MWSKPNQRRAGHGSLFENTTQILKSWFILIGLFLKFMIHLDKNYACGNRFGRQNNKTKLWFGIFNDFLGVSFEISLLQYPCKTTKDLKYVLPGLQSDCGQAVMTIFGVLNYIDVSDITEL